MTDSELIKFCRSCEQTKPVDAFYRSTRERDGLQSMCRTCKRAYLVANREKVNASHREYMLRTGRQKNAVRIKVEPKPKPPPAVRQAKVDRKRLLRGLPKQLRGALPTRSALQKYGMRDGDYEALFVAQGGRCAICFRTPTRQRLVVDHCHTSGAVRGLLCNWCNLALGYLGDTYEGVQIAVDYLRSRRHPGLLGMDGSLRSRRSAVEA